MVYKTLNSHIRVTSRSFGDLFGVLLVAPKIGDGYVKFWELVDWFYDILEGGNLFNAF